MSRGEVQSVGEGDDLPISVQDTEGLPLSGQSGTKKVADSESQTVLTAMG
jgi:hypothetical protein